MMNYALIENGVVTNVIYLHPANAQEFPGAVLLGEIPAGIGDTWDGEHFWRNGEQVLSPLERAQAETQDMLAALSLLGVESEVQA